MGRSIIYILLFLFCLKLNSISFLLFRSIRLVGDSQRIVRSACVEPLLELGKMLNNNDTAEYETMIQAALDKLNEDGSRLVAIHSFWSIWLQTHPVLWKPALNRY